MYSCFTMYFQVDYVWFCLQTRINGCTAATSGRLTVATLGRVEAVKAFRKDTFRRHNRSSCGVELCTNTVSDEKHAFIKTDPTLYMPA